MHNTIHHPMTWVLFLALSGVVSAFGETSTAPMGHPEGQCTLCHVSPTPTKDNADLRTCLRDTVPQESNPAGQEAPDFFIMDELSEFYVPVVFPHRFHASMTQMGMGCNTCHHHHDEEDHIVRCSFCHGNESDQENLRKPSLKGAYHRQCMGCHRELSHDVQCVYCHAKRVPGEEIVIPKDITDVIQSGDSHAKAPDLHLYQIEGMGVIGFRHQDHVERFGLSCATCHRKWDCSRCHESPERRTGRPARHQQPGEPHEICNLCHQREVEDRCDYCHGDEVRPAFDHGRDTVHSLRAFHASVPCQGCHGDQTRFSSVEQACSACHTSEWMPEHFDHSVIGIFIDETHNSMGCRDCHPSGLGAPPSCTECHDDGRTSFPPLHPEALSDGENQQAKPESNS